MAERLAEIEVTFLAHSQGGRTHTLNLNGGSYRPHFRVRGDAEYLGIEFVEAPDGEVHPGEPIQATVRLVYEPQVSYDKLVVGAEFEILEGARIVGNGHVVRI